VRAATTLKCRALYLANLRAQRLVGGITRCVLAWACSVRKAVTSACLPGTGTDHPAAAFHRNHRQEEVGAVVDERHLDVKRQRSGLSPNSRLDDAVWDN